MRKHSYVLRGVFIFQSIRGFLHLSLFRTSSARSIIERDIDRWLSVYKKRAGQVRFPYWKRLVHLIWRYPEFRSLFYYRLEREHLAPRRILIEIAKWLFKPMSTLYIYTPAIGPALFIEHGFCTIISANQIGENCWINQQVTIGYSKGSDGPVMGNNVRVGAGAVVLGKINIGDNSIIGANSVVTKDVPPNCTVVGVPGYIIRREGHKVKEPL